MTEIVKIQPTTEAEQVNFTRALRHIAAALAKPKETKDKPA